MTIKNFRDEYADCACSYENLNAIGEDLKHSPLKKRYNSLLESVLRSMKFMQCAFLRNFPKKEADFKKTIQMLQVNNDFAATVDLMREFPEICKGRLEWIVSCKALTRLGIVSFRLRASATTLALPG